MTEKHTPDPWRRYPNKELRRAIVCHGGDEEGIGSEVIATFHGELGPDNAERVLACVNAYRGLNPEAVPEMVDFLKFVRGDQYDGNYSPDEFADMATNILKKAGVTL